MSWSYKIHKPEGVCHESVAVAEGIDIFCKSKLANTSGTLTPEYHIRDHLGNVRVTVSPTQSLRNELVVKQVNAYYPFGKTAYHMDSGSGNQLKYNGKELQHFSLNNISLGWYDYGARFYDPTLGRWHSVDPLAELGRRWSPYSYCFNNPILFIDPDGIWPTRNVVDNGREGRRFSLTPVLHPVLKTVSRRHLGQDFPAPIGNNVYSLAVGIVVNVGYQMNNDGTGWGHYVDIQHRHGYLTRYAHLQEGGIKVKTGSEVTDGQIFALSGASGGVTGPHVHLEITLNGEPIDPSSVEDLEVILQQLDPIYDAGLQGEVVVTGERPSGPAPRPANQVQASEATQGQSGYSSPFQQRRLQPGDYGYQGSFWYTYDNLRNWGNE